MLYEGSCHCGAVQFEADLDIQSLISCNCSICERKGLLLAFTTPDHFKLLNEGPQGDYQFGSKTIHHLFCKNCGVTSYSHGAGSDGKKMIAINARSLENFDIHSVPHQKYDGRSL